MWVCQKENRYVQKVLINTNSKQKGTPLANAKDFC